MTRSRDESKGFLSEQRWVGPLSAILIAVGTLSRLAPLTEPHGRLLRQFMSEDGYLMQIVARNLGAGLGMSVSDGTVQTNGVQPLATFVFSFFYFLSGGDKIGGIAIVTLFSVFVSLAAAYLLYILVRKVLKDFPDERALALLVTALWFASPLIVKHSMNGLETGLYFLITLATLNVFINLVEKNPTEFSLKQMLSLGAMLGLCFLVRNDAAFFIAAILLARFVLLWPSSVKLWRDRIVEATVPGLVSVLIGLPWLIYNYRLFGSIMPISGIAESADARFGQNLIYVPAPILEYVMMILPIPGTFETKPLTIILSVLIVAVAAVWAVNFLWTESRIGTRVVVVTYVIFGCLVISFYGLFFGAPYFMSRYLSILSPFLALLGVIAAYRCLVLMPKRLRQATLMPAAASVAIVAVGLNGMLYRNGLHHEHFQVVDWVKAHVPAQTWVGAIQTGTLGFFHDRTINLDGKVSPEALRAKLNEGGAIPYILRSEIKYLVDWHGIAEWIRIEKGGFNQKFELVLADQHTNLAVLRRIDGDTAAPSSGGQSR